MTRINISSFFVDLISKGEKKMKKFLLPTILAVAVCAAAPLAVANQTTTASAEGVRPSVTIVGEAKRELAPDFATITLGIENLDSDMAAAKDKTFASFDKMVEILVSEGIEKESIVVESYYSRPNYDYSSTRSIAGYYSNLNFTYSVSDLSLIKTTISAVTDLTPVNVQSVNYQISNEKEIYNELLSEALSTARTKAEMVLGKTDILLSGMEEECLYYSNSLYRCYNESLESQDMIGKVTIKARVKASFC